jgi:hypothetical protein
MLAEGVRAGYWFNPIMWTACRQLRLESEQATDDVVLHAGIDGSDYAAHLLALARAFARQRPWLPAPAIARPSSLERRVKAMLNTRVNRAPITRTARLGIVAALFAVAIAIASAQGTFSTFSGTVFDPMNGYLPGVTMTLTNTESGAKHEIRSDRTGTLVWSPPGSYSLQAILLLGSDRHTRLDRARRAARRHAENRTAAGDDLGLGQPRMLCGHRGTSCRRVAHDPSMMKACSRRRRPRAAWAATCQPSKLVDVKPRYPQELADAGTGGVFASRR